MRTVLGALAIAVVAACGPSTTIEQAWTTPKVATQPRLEKVVTMFISNNLTMRHAGEDRLAADLAAHGISATPSYLIFGDQPTSNLPAVRERLRQMGYDGVVTMRIVDREQGVDYTPSTFDGYWGYWGGYYGYAGYYGTYTYDIYRLETAAYSLATNQLVWSALTKTVDPDSAHKLLDSTSKVVATQLARNGLAG
jgi:hypothetical protein